MKIGSVTIQLLNAPMKHTGVIEARTIYHLSGSSFIGRTATIYALFPGITDINTDGLIIFKGIIQPPSKVTPDSLTFTIKDSSTKDHAKIPADIFTTDFPTDSIAMPTRMSISLILSFMAPGRSMKILTAVCLRRNGFRQQN